MRFTHIHAHVNGERLSGALSALVLTCAMLGGRRCYAVQGCWRLPVEPSKTPRQPPLPIWPSSMLLPRSGGWAERYHARAQGNPTDTAEMLSASRPISLDAIGLRPAHPSPSLTARSAPAATPMFVPRLPAAEPTRRLGGGGGVGGGGGGRSRTATAVFPELWRASLRSAIDAEGCQWCGLDASATCARCLPCRIMLRKSPASSWPCLAA